MTPRALITAAVGALTAGAMATTIAAAGTGGAPRAMAAQGSLSVSPSIIETTAKRGAATSTVIRNTTSAALRITVRARPWNQSRSGGVTANRSRRLSGVGLSPSRFRLGAGESRRVFATMGALPSRRSLYGALEAVGRPVKRRPGVNLAYRIVASLRFNPSGAARRYSLRAGRASASGGTVGVLIRNAGNTADPVGGTARITGPGRGRSASVTSVRILPGNLVRVRLASARGLRRGSYKAQISLTQGGKRRLGTTRSFTVR